jgi:hypothetical protein
MRSWFLVLASALLGLAFAPSLLVGQSATRVQIRLDTTAAVAVLRLLDDSAAPPSDADWEALFATDGYRRLKAREIAMRRSFTDSAFTWFVRSDSLRSRAASLRQTLTAWTQADLGSAASRALAYLPADARVVATVYPMIKPATNSFVWDTETDPAIFLYLDPARTPEQFENVVAHELHHIGYSSIRAATDSMVAALPDSVRPVAQWIGALGEGFAMLAAAGGADSHPHATSPAADRARWDADLTRFNADVENLNAFFTDILTRRLAEPDSIRAVAMGFFGVQGPWYTVGWRMAVEIERQFGRAELIRCMSDPHFLLATYNRAATQYNRTHSDSLQLWSPAVVSALLPAGSSGAPGSPP